MKIWLDDLRPAPSEFVWCRSVNEAKKVIEKNKESVNDYKNGHDRALKYLMGQVMKETKGSVNPKKASDMLREALNK